MRRLPNCTIQNGRLAVDFKDECRSYFIAGEKVGDDFYVGREKFESFPSLTVEDRELIKQSIEYKNIFIV